MSSKDNSEDIPKSQDESEVQDESEGQDESKGQGESKNKDKAKKKGKSKKRNKSKGLKWRVYYDRVPSDIPDKSDRRKQHFSTRLIAAFDIEHGDGADADDSSRTDSYKGYMQFPSEYRVSTRKFMRDLRKKHGEHAIHVTIERQNDDGSFTEPYWYKIPPNTLALGTPAPS